MAGQDSQNFLGGESCDTFAEMDHSVNSGLVLRCLQCLKGLGERKTGSTIFWEESCFGHSDLLFAELYIVDNCRTVSQSGSLLTLWETSSDLNRKWMSAAGFTLTWHLLACREMCRCLIFCFTGLIKRSFSFRRRGTQHNPEHTNAFQCLTCKQVSRGVDYPEESRI